MKWNDVAADFLSQREVENTLGQNSGLQAVVENNGVVKRRRVCSVMASLRTM